MYFFITFGPKKNLEKKLRKFFKPKENEMTYNVKICGIKAALGGKWIKKKKTLSPRRYKSSLETRK